MARNYCPSFDRPKRAYYCGNRSSVEMSYSRHCNYIYIYICIYVYMYIYNHESTTTTLLKYLIGMVLCVFMPVLGLFWGLPPFLCVFTSESFCLSTYAEGLLFLSAPFRTRWENGYYIWKLDPSLYPTSTHPPITILDPPPTTHFHPPPHPPINPVHTVVWFYWKVMTFSSNINKRVRGDTRAGSTKI